MKPSRRMEPITSFIVMDILEEAMAMERAGGDIVHMEVGEPDFPPPPAVVDELARAARDGNTHYTHSLGRRDLREAVAGWYGRRYGVKVDPECVIITPGTSGAFLNAMAVLLDRGDRIALTDPGYPCYPNFARILGIEPAPIRIEPDDGFVPRMERVRGAIDSGAGALLIASPANPTGTIVPPAELEMLTRLPVPLISDEIYHGLEYGGAKTETALRFTGDAVVISGLSKRMAMTGLRIGWAIVPKDLVRPFQKLNQNLYICADSVSQCAAAVALSDPSCDAYAEEMRRTYEKRRSALISGLKKLGFNLHHDPAGAFYVFADCSAFCGDSFEFVRRMLREANVASTPGKDFGSHMTGRFVRFAYTVDVSRIEEGLHRLGRWLERQP